MPLLVQIGSTVVTSHTAKVHVDFTDPETLESAVRSMGGLWYGKGQYDLGDSRQTGYGFRLPMADGIHKEDGRTFWYHPLVALSNGELAYDEYGGRWGNVADLDRLKARYAEQQVISAADNLGWLWERTEAGILVHAPTGGTLTLSAGQIETAGFVGSGCHAAREALGIAVEDIRPTAEAGTVVATVSVPA